MVTRSFTRSSGFFPFAAADTNRWTMGRAVEGLQGAPSRPLLARMLHVRTEASHNVENVSPRQLPRTASEAYGAGGVRLGASSLGLVPNGPSTHQHGRQRKPRSYSWSLSILSPHAVLSLRFVLLTAVVIVAFTPHHGSPRAPLSGFVDIFAPLAASYPAAEALAGVASKKLLTRSPPPPASPFAFGTAHAVTHTLPLSVWPQAGALSLGGPA